MSDLTDVLAEGSLASEGLTFALALEIDENVTASETWVALVKPGELVIEIGLAHDQVSFSNVKFFTSLSEAGVASERWRVSRALSVQDSATTSEIWKPAFAPSQVERGVAHDALTPSVHYNLSRAESALAAESWSYSDAKNLSEIATAHDAFSYTYVAGLSLTETAHASDTLTSVRGAFASLHEVGVEQTTLIDNYHYNDIMIENGLARISYMSPSGNTTTWAINLRNQAITEYRDFDFNSFGSRDRKYLGANGVGLFELNGNQDVFANILAKIGGGFFQANSMKQSGLKGVYIAVGGQGPAVTGDWFLKLIMGDGRELTYKATSNPGLMVSKINIGKGLRASYMTWELMSAGQDFDFDKIEFVPMMSGRRVG